jgi:hypothetical protein
MDWLAENWFFVLLLIAFIAMHLFGHGHGGRGGHGGHGRDRPAPPDSLPRSGGASTGHRH